MLADADPVLILAFDHRTSLVRGLFDGDEAAAAARAPAAKGLVLDGLRRALVLEPPAGRYRPGVLVDDRYGAAVAREARQAGILTAVAVERSGQAELAFEHGDAFAPHAEALDPDCVKVLVRYNADGDAALNARQRATLRQLTAWAGAAGRPVMLELLVPPTPEQLAAAGGDQQRFDVEQRTALTVRALEELRADGIQAALLKLEGFDRPADAALTAAAAAPTPVLVLGRGADDAAVTRWLRVAAATPGFDGFAIGRSIWWEAIADHLGGRLDEAGAVERIAGKYAAATRTWLDARRASAAQAHGVVVPEDVGVDERP